MHPLKWHTSSKDDFPFKRVKVSRACKECRRKKMRCDAARPMCDRCTKNNLSCSYDENPFPSDKAATNVKKHSLDCRCHDDCLASYVRDMELRVQELEAKLRSISSEPGSVDNDAFSPPDSSVFSTLDSHVGSPALVDDTISEHGMTTITTLENDFAMFPQSDTSDLPSIVNTEGASTPTVSGLYEDLLKYQTMHKRVLPEVGCGWSSLGVYGTLASRSSSRWEPLTRLLRAGRHMIFDQNKVEVILSNEMRDTLMDLFFANVYHIYPIVSRRFVAQLKLARESRAETVSADQCLMHLYYVTLRIASEDLLLTEMTFAHYIFNCCSVLFHANQKTIMDNTLTGVPRPDNPFPQDSVLASEYLLTATQSCFLSVFYQGSIGNIEDAFVVLSQAIRNAQVLGLHKKKNKVIDLDEEGDMDVCSEERKRQRMEKVRENERLKRLWWGMYITDVCLRLYQNQPMMIDDEECDVDLPLIPVFSPALDGMLGDGNMHIDSRPQVRTRLQAGDVRSLSETEYTEENESDCLDIEYFVHYLKSVRVQKYILKFLYSKTATQRGKKIWNVVRVLDDRLEEFRRYLPPSMQFSPDSHQGHPFHQAHPSHQGSQTAPSILLHIVYQTMRIQIHQQFIAPPPFAMFILDEQSVSKKQLFIPPSTFYSLTMPLQNSDTNTTATKTRGSAISLQVCTSAAQRITECLGLLTDTRNNEAYLLNVVVLGCCLAASIHARNLKVEIEKLRAQHSENEEVGQGGGLDFETATEAKQWLQRTGDAIKSLAENNPTCARLGEILQEMIDEETRVLDKLQEASVEGLTNGSNADDIDEFAGMFEDVMGSYEQSIDDSNSESVDMFLNPTDQYDIECNGQGTPSLVSSSRTSESASSLSSLPTSTHFTDIHPYFNVSTSTPQFPSVNHEFMSTTSYSFLQSPTSQIKMFVPQERRPSYSQIQNSQGFAQTPRTSMPASYASYPAPPVDNQFLMQTSQASRPETVFANHPSSMVAAMRQAPIPQQQTIHRTRVHPAPTATARQFTPTQLQRYSQPSRFDYFSSCQVESPPPRFPQHLINTGYDTGASSGMEDQPPEYVVPSQFFEA
ncbi:hypothetical protein BC937DRAFT_93805 [Endogone sp. FLAS-F59071]|nr:hypothetical protein BC937DRAFT_93805 [Endogone sp. FLAS-F59071]|eukprot:RUS14449.1 hypothetical protein BC937DRAFT_93805 [Endogone sp. FLAS-F59071]